MKTITYEGVQHGDWVRCVLCGAQMLLPCGADKCPECGENGTYTTKNSKNPDLQKKHCEGLRKHIANLERRLLKHILTNVILSIISVATIIALFTLIQN